LAADDRATNSEGRQGGSETPQTHSRRFLFPRWSNLLGPVTGVLAVGGLLYATVLITAVFNPKTSAIGYAPDQPVPYNHAQHVGLLGMDCRYCHTTVETSAQASIPPAETCMNCHARVFTESPKLLPIREAVASGRPVRWARVHDLPDFAYFDHSAHVNAGVGCVSCHGRVDKMEVVSQQKKLTMSWCLECHRQPEPNLRPREFVTSMDWVPDKDPFELGSELRRAHDINPSTDCTTCHR